MNLVTGATGHIGNVLVRELLHRGEQVRALILPGEDRTPLIDLDVEIIEGDVLIPKTLIPAFIGIRNVFHLAGIISILPGENDLLRKVNVEGTQNVLDVSIQCGVHRLVYTSSIHAVSRVPHGVTIDESIPYDPDTAISAYDRSKAEASLAVLEAARHGLNAVLVCPTGVIGPYDYRRSEMGQLILDCVEKKLQWYVDGAYDFVDVRDVAFGLIQANQYGRSGESYILSGERISVRGLLETIWEITGERFAQIKIPARLARFAALFTPLYYQVSKVKPRFTRYSLETLWSNSNISHAKAQNELSYIPRSLRQSIVDTVRWFMENRQLFARAPKPVIYQSFHP